MTDLYLFGAGVMGRVVADLVAWQFADRYRVAGFFDDGRRPGEEIAGHGRVLGGVVDAPDFVTGDSEVFLCLGSRHRGKALALLAELRGKGVTLARLVSPSAHLAPSARLGDNALLMPGALLGCGSAAGDLFFAYGNATVEHDVSIGHGVLFGPGASAASGARVGHGALVGVGATLSNSVTLGAGALLGAGAVAVRDIPTGTVALGNPARSIRPVRAGDEVILPEHLRELDLPA